MRVAFIGLGNMGFPMAGHLASKGHAVTVWNRTPGKAELWHQTYGGEVAATPAEAARGAAVVLTCVGRDSDLEAVLFGPDGLLKGLEAGAVLVDHSTVSADLSRRLAEILAERGVDFIDAPVSGGQPGAQAGQLTIMCGGDTASYERVQPVLASYAKAISLMGPVGSGQLTKMVNQIAVAGVLQGLAEAIHFAQQADLDVAKVIGAISQGAAASWQMQHRWQPMVENFYTHGFAVDWMRKDLAIVLDEARRNGAQLPATALIDQFYADVQHMGGGRWDTSSLLARLQRAPSTAD